MESAGTPLSSLLDRGNLFLFFAALPDETVWPVIDEMVAGVRHSYGLKGTFIQPQHRHVTLRPIGLDTGDIAARAMSVAETVQFQPFAVSMGEVTSFYAREKCPLVLVDEGGTDGFRDLQRDLGRAMKRKGFRQIGDREPHMTLGYDRRITQAARVGPVRWTVREFVLIRSQRGQTRYDILGRWPARSI